VQLKGNSHCVLVPLTKQNEFSDCLKRLHWKVAFNGEFARVKILRKLLN